MGGSAGGTATGALKGKVAYMAPESIDSGDADARSDVFALGVVAWEAIDTLRMALAAVAAPVSSVVPSIGTSLDAVIAKALARSPDDRFSSAREFGEALEAAARPGDLIASYAQVGERVRVLMEGTLERRRALIRERTNAPPESSTVRPSAPMTRRR